MLEIKELRKEYAGGKNKKTVLDGINLTVADAGLTVICGSSGSGKSTLLHLIGGLDKPSSGKILFNGTDITDLKKVNPDKYRSSCVGFVSQDFGLISALNVRENCLISVRLQEKDEKAAAERAEKALSEVGLSGFENRKINTLSGGEKQRVAIARALAQNSELLLCDEPTGNLDPENANTVFKILKKISERICVLVVTHDHRLGKEYADRIIYLKDGKTTEDSSSDGIKTKKYSATEQTERADSESIKENKTRFGINGLRTLLKSQFRPHLIAVILLFVILTVMFSVVAASEHVKDYSRPGAIAGTLEDYRVSFLKLCPYTVDYDEGDNEFYTSFQDGTSSEDDVRLLEEKYPDAVFGRSYMFTNTLKDFFPDAELSNRSYFRCGAFLHFITVDSFEGYHPELLCGDYPKEAEDVLIYDYMAANILHFVSIPGVEKPEQLIGYTMTEQDTGLRMRISGIMKSNYLDCSFTDDDGWEEKMSLMEVTFYKSYLSSLRSVIGFSSMAEKVKEGQNYVSTFGFTLYMSKPTDAYMTELITHISKIPIVYYGTEMNLIYYDQGNGIYYSISDTLLSELADIPLEELTEEKIRDLFETEDFIGLPCYVSSGKEYECAFESDHSGYVVGGVFRSDECKAYLVEETEGRLGEKNKHNGLYENPVLLLSEKTRENTRLLRSLLLPYGEELQSGNAAEDGYAVCTYFEIVLNQADEFLQDFGMIAEKYYWVVMLSVLLILIAFVFVMIQKNQYSLGVLKSVGVPDVTIAVVYGISLILITAASFLLSLGMAAIGTGFINGIFSGTVGIPFRFFSAGGLSGLRTMAIAGGAVVISLLLTFAVFLTRKPVKLKNAD